ncbi:MAG: IS66 family transposase, partial [Planctomycetota bacterium]|nr:IS66 family transposase [Planctomycetota bacterium]
HSPRPAANPQTKTKKFDVGEVSHVELQQLLAEIKDEVSSERFEFIERMAGTVEYLFELLGKEGVTIRDLRKLFLGHTRPTEKTKDVLGEPTEDATSTEPDATEGEKQDAEPTGTDDDKEAPKGHGRNGADDYPGAEIIPIPHPDLKPGDACPACDNGTVYQQPPGKILRITGQPMIAAKVYEPEKLRCSLCGKIFTAELPLEAGHEKYDAHAGSIIALMKYGTGMPFHRMEKLQQGFGVPLPSSTQWDIVHTVSRIVEPVYYCLIDQAAQGQIFHNDDTGMTILAIEPDPSLNPERTGTFTTGIVVLAGEHKIALFFTGRKHAGENLNQVLDKRSVDSPVPIQMSDALSRNSPRDHQTNEANCNTHGRRNFVKIVDNFPEHCRRVLEDLRDVYRNDAEAKEQNMSPQERLQHHQQHSQPIMEALKEWMEQELHTRQVEPNSSLGKAMNYMLNHWEKLTLFLRKPGAPLDNNICERALKMAILHRKNALFYKTENGARVGDIFMTIIHTCRLCEANPFDYLTALQQNAARISATPEDWLPWNYRQTMLQLGAATV